MSEPVIGWSALPSAHYHSPGEEQQYRRDAEQDPGLDQLEAPIAVGGVVGGSGGQLSTAGGGRPTAADDPAVRGAAGGVQRFRNRGRRRNSTGMRTIKYPTTVSAAAGMVRRRTPPARMPRATATRT